MSSKTKIVVLRMKEILYTAIFAGLALLLILLCTVMFRSRDEAPTEHASLYRPGVYSAGLTLGSRQVNVEVTVDSDRITGISLVPLDQAVATMYPLVQPSLDQLSEQILSSQSTEELTYPDSSRYTCAALVKTIDAALEKARLATE